MWMTQGLQYVGGTGRRGRSRRRQRETSPGLWPDSAAVTTLEMSFTPFSLMACFASKFK